MSNSSNVISAIFTAHREGMLTGKVLIALCKRLNMRDLPA